MTDVDLLFTYPHRDDQERHVLPLLLAVLQKRHLIPPHGLLSAQHTASNRVGAANLISSRMDSLDRAFVIFKHPFTGRISRVDLVFAKWTGWSIAVQCWTGSTTFNRALRMLVDDKYVPPLSLPSVDHNELMGSGG